MYDWRFEVKCGTMMLMSGAMREAEAAEEEGGVS